jgi:hypothetical protein
MARPILGTPQAAKISTSGVTPTTTARSTLQGPRLQQRLREKRSTKYVQAMARLDAGTHHADRPALESLLEAISNEFPELGIEQLPVGIVSQCYLGAPYEVHICDLSDGIVEHFKTFQPMPPLFERGRTLSLHPCYVFIEVYPDTLRAVALDGSVSVVEC